jgi:hypothetical protein
MEGARPPELATVPNIVNVRAKHSSCCMCGISREGLGGVHARAPGYQRSATGPVFLRCEKDVRL